MTERKQKQVLGYWSEEILNNVNGQSAAKGDKKWGKN